LKEGHLLICPKEHYLGYSDLPPSLFKELGFVVGKVYSALQKYYGEPIFFEHGPVKERMGGNSVDHAHLHAVPKDIDESKTDIFEDIIKDFDFRKTVREVQDFKEVKIQQNKKIPYLYYRDSTAYGHKFIFEIRGKTRKDFPSQYLRRVVAKRLGREEYWNYKWYPNEPAIERALKILRGSF
jgi:diadenosine tetraphosphate (Ap4A) HIT family hydrolase